MVLFSKVDKNNQMRMKAHSFLLIMGVVGVVVESI